MTSIEFKCNAQPTHHARLVGAASEVERNWHQTLANFFGGLQVATRAHVKLGSAGSERGAANHESEFPFGKDQAVQGKLTPRYDSQAPGPYSTQLSFQRAASNPNLHTDVSIPPFPRCVVLPARSWVSKVGGRRSRRCRTTRSRPTHRSHSFLSPIFTCPCSYCTMLHNLKPQPVSCESHDDTAQGTGFL
jgi:hypothetical protein